LVPSRPAIPYTLEKRKIARLDITQEG